MTQEIPVVDAMAYVSRGSGRTRNERRDTRVIPAVGCPCYADRSPRGGRAWDTCEHIKECKTGKACVPFRAWVTQTKTYCMWWLESSRKPSTKIWDEIYTDQDDT